MSSIAVVGFVKCLMNAVCLEFFETEGKTPADKLCGELMEFSHHFLNAVRDYLYDIPLKIMECEDFFIKFLNSVCSDICEELVGCEGSDERKFFAMCGFLMNVATISILIPCYRLMRNVATVLIHQLQTNVSLNLDCGSNVFKNLEGKCLKMVSERCWMNQCIRLFKQFVIKAENACPVSSKVPNVKFRIECLSEFRNPESANADFCQNENCSFCSKNCKAQLLAFLS